MSETGVLCESFEQKLIFSKKVVKFTKNGAILFILQNKRRKMLHTIGYIENN